MGATYQYFIDAYAGGSRKKLVLIRDLFGSNCVPEVLTHLDHVHAYELRLQHS